MTFQRIELNDETYPLFNTRKLKPRLILEELLDRVGESGFFKCLCGEAYLDLKMPKGNELIHQVLCDEQDTFLHGFAYYILRDFAKCISNLQGVDHFFANFLLGVCYQNGFGTVSNGLKALEFYNRSYEQGYFNSCSNIGMIYQIGTSGVEKSQEKAFYYFDLASQKDFGIAVYNVGYAYFHGLGVERNQDKSFSMMQKASDLGCSNSYLYMGCFYHQGKIVPQDFAKAVSYFKLGSEADVPYSNYFLAICYYNGDGCMKDKKAAYHHFKLASSLGVREAKEYLSHCYIWDTDLVHAEPFSVTQITIPTKKMENRNFLSTVCCDRVGRMYYCSGEKCFVFTKKSFVSTFLVSFREKIDMCKYFDGVLYFAMESGAIETYPQTNTVINSRGCSDFLVVNENVVVLSENRKYLSCYSRNGLLLKFQKDLKRHVTGIACVNNTSIALSFNQSIELLDVATGEITVFIDTPDSNCTLQTMAQPEFWISYTSKGVRMWEGSLCIHSLQVENITKRNLNGACFVDDWLVLASHHSLYFFRNDIVKEFRIGEQIVKIIGSVSGSCYVETIDQFHHIDVRSWLHPSYKGLIHQEFIDCLIFTGEKVHSTGQ